MSKAKVYACVKKGWRQWDEEAYRLAASMYAAFSGVIDNPDADAQLVADVGNLGWELQHYEAAMRAKKPAADMSEVHDALQSRDR